MRAFVCPTCRAVMLKAKGSWDVWYCPPCNYEWDVYRPEGSEPEKVEVDSVQEYNVWADAVVITPKRRKKNLLASFFKRLFGR